MGMSMYKIRILIVAIGLLLSGCASLYTSSEKVTDDKPYLSKSQKETWGLMIGKWYGSQPTTTGNRKDQITEHLPDGTYRIRFRVVSEDNKVRETIEVGQWGVSGPIYFAIFRGWLKDGKLEPSRTSDPYNYDAYRMINLTNKKFEYEHMSTGTKYVINKMPSDFEFPNE
mgnify:FL=1